MSALFEQSSAARLETPFALRHVESHLVFGFFARRFPFVYVILSAMLVGIGSTLLDLLALGQHPPPDTFDRISAGMVLPGLLLAVWVAFASRRLSWRQQAILGWWITKIMLGVFSFMLFFAGALVGFFRGDPDAWLFLALVILWVPSVEFLPKVTPRQRYLTLARLVVTTLLLGYRGF
jgi:hypothetical protein